MKIRVGNLKKFIQENLVKEEFNQDEEFAVEGSAEQILNNLKGVLLKSGMVLLEDGTVRRLTSNDFEDIKSNVKTEKLSGNRSVVTGELKTKPLKNNEKYVFGNKKQFNSNVIFFVRVEEKNDQEVILSSTVVSPLTPEWKTPPTVKVVKRDQLVDSVRQELGSFVGEIIKKLS